MGSNHKVNETKSWTNAGKAEELLKKYKLYGSKEIVATPQTLKVLFGKDGVLRLLRDSWLTRNEVSLFESMTHTLVNGYIQLKFYSIKPSDFSVLNKFNQLNAKLYSVLDNKTYKFFGEKSMKYKERIRDLEKNINRLKSQASSEEVSAMQRFEAANSAEAGADAARMQFEAVNAAIKEHDRNSKIKDLSNEKSETINKEKQLFVELDKTISEIKEVIKSTKDYLQCDIESLRGFCDLCNGLGKKYYNQKQAGLLSFKTNKLKKEAARICMIIKPE